MPGQTFRDEKNGSKFRFSGRYPGWPKKSRDHDMALFWEVLGVTFMLDPYKIGV